MIAADGYAYRNYIADPQEWYNLFKISWQGPPGIYRLVVPLRPDEALDGDEALATAQRKLQRFNPRPASYEIAFYDSYTVAQRVAAPFRNGRMLLAAHTPHPNTPIAPTALTSALHAPPHL